MKFYSVVFFLSSMPFFLSCGGSNQENQCIDLSEDNSKLTRYKITFNSTWSKETHPKDFPSNPHYSKLVGASHKTTYSMWQEGNKASPGVKEVAETGKPALLQEELTIAQKIRSVCGYTVASSDISTSPATGEITISVHEDFPLLSLITMIAPSPDWFVGISAFNLREKGEWITSKTLKAIPWDAGTDSGETYISSDAPLEEADIISKIISEPFPLENGSSSSLGNFIITKI